MPQKKLTEEQKANLLKKGWRIQSLYWIVNRDTESVKFKPNSAQKHYFLNRRKRNIILKSRRLGFTTFACMDMMDDAMFTPNYRALMVAQDEPTMHELFEKIKYAWLHFIYKPLYDIDTDRANQLTVGFKDGDKGESLSFSTVIVKQSGRGGGYNHVHISEFGKICAKYPEKVKEILSGTFKTVPIDGKLTIESTAEGENNKFYDMFWDAWDRPTTQIHRPTDFKAFFYNWQWDKEEIAKVTEVDAQIPQEFIIYQTKHNEKCEKYIQTHGQLPYYMKPITDLELTYYFYKWLDSKDWNIHMQEYPTTPEEAFVFSGTKFFDQTKLQLLENQVKEPQVMNDWHYYYPYEPGHVYGMAADPSEGVGKDACAAVIMDFTPIKPRVVATFQNPNIGPDVFALELTTAARSYNFPLLAVERNNHGHATITKLKGIYPERALYKEEREEYEETKETDKIGWHTNLSTKPRMFYDLRTAVNEEQLHIPSKALQMEMRTYDSHNLNQTKAKEDQTRHWDLLTALAICFQMRTRLHQSTQTITVTNYNRKSTKNLHSSL